MKLIALTSVIGFGTELLPHWLDYYAGLGVDEIAILLAEAEPGSIRVSMDRIYDYQQSSNHVVPVRLLIPSLTADPSIYLEFNHRACDRLRRAFASPDDWIIPTDLDEFIQFPSKPRRIAEIMQRHGKTHLIGNQVDRLSRDGCLNHVFGSPSIFEQFPLEACVVANMMGTTTTKVILCRGDVELRHGHHGAVSKAGRWRKYGIKVHHFKWKNTLVEWVEELRRFSKADLVQCDRFEQYMALHGRIRPKDFGAVKGWIPR